MSTIWKLHGETAALETASLTAVLAVGDHTAGLANLRADNQPLGGGLWGWTVENHTKRLTEPAPKASRLDDSSLDQPPNLPCTDAYVRGADLVLSYGATAACPFDTQVYWRWNASMHGDPGWLSLLVSVRTALLDTRPVFRVRSTRPAGEVLLTADPTDNTGLRRFGGGFSAEDSTAMLQRLPSGVSLVEASHPRDGARLSLQTPQGLAEENTFVEWRLFDHFLEKGVIRRARLAAAVLPRQEDADAASRVLRRFAETPLPLTT